jgi:hypothetical protein
MHHCIDKPAFKTEAEARCRGMYRLMIRREVLDHRLNTYECMFGNHFHFGNKPKWMEAK